MVSCSNVCERRRQDGVFDFFFNRGSNLRGSAAVYGQYETASGKDYGYLGMTGSGIKRPASV